MVIVGLNVLLAVCAIGQQVPPIRPISCGPQRLVICEDGTVQGWGYNFCAIAGGDPSQWYNQQFLRSPQPVVVLRDVVQVAAGVGARDYSEPLDPWPRIPYFSLALKRDGTIWGWGCAEDEGQLLEVGGSLVPKQITTTLTDVIQIAACPHVLALRQDGTVYGWGPNYDAQIRGAAPAIVWLPEHIAGIDSVIQVETGSTGTFTLALRADGTVWWWGTPLPSRRKRLSPERIAGLSDIVAITKSYVALRRDGTVWAWTPNDTTNDPPYPLNGLHDIVAMTAGGYYPSFGTEWYVLAIRRDSTLWGWGHNLFGSLGIGRDTGYFPQPVRIPLERVVAVHALGDCSYAITSDGTLWAWGFNGDGGLGLGKTAEELPYVTIPTKVPSICTINSIPQSPPSSHGVRVTPTISTDGKFILDGTLAEPMEAMVLSLTGIPLHHRSIQLLPAELDLSYCPSGVYFLILRTRNVFTTEKIVLIR